MRQNFFQCSGIPKDGGPSQWIGHTFARKANAVKFARSMAPHFCSITVWSGGIGGLVVAQVQPGYTYISEVDGAEYQAGLDEYLAKHTR